MFEGPFKHSIIKKAIEKKIITIEFVNIRQFGIGRHKIVDDTPYGGGKGMILRVDVLDRAIANVKCSTKDRSNTKCRQRIILMDAKGEKFTQKKAEELSKHNHLILICGHYEGVDERTRNHLVDESISIGDYVLTGGEIPAMVIVDSIIRLIPGVIKEESRKFESFSYLFDKKETLVLEYPQYTKPKVYKSFKVPKILFSGNHRVIEEWRKKQAIKLTKNQRPDLLDLKT